MDEEFISKAINLPQRGECWFKGAKIEKKKFKQFLLPLSKDDAHLKHCFPVKYLKPQWCLPFQVNSRYISCDGHYSNVHLYHLRILLDLTSSKLNLPYFLLHSLHRMAITVQRTTVNQSHSLFNFFLIKILVQYQLAMMSRTWDEFLSDICFGLTSFWPTFLPKNRIK